MNGHELEERLHLSRVVVSGRQRLDDRDRTRDVWRAYYVGGVSCRRSMRCVLTLVGRVRLVVRRRDGPSGRRLRPGSFKRRCRLEAIVAMRPGESS